MFVTSTKKFYGTHVYLIWVFIGLHMWNNVYSCPFVCTCTGTTVNCSDTKLTAVPNDISVNTTDLYLPNNNLSLSNSLDNLKNLTGLKLLDLSYSNISAIPTTSLTNLKQLETLYLGGNKITRIYNNTFSGLSLKELNLNNNSILETIEIDAFNGSKIQDVIMNHCNLKYLEKRIFQPIQESLKKVHVSYNKQRPALTDNLFFGFILDEISFVQSWIDSYSFLYSASVNILDLSHNPLGDKAWYILANTKINKELYLRNVKTTIVDIMLKQELSVLDVSQNSLKSINGPSFRNLPNLQNLTMNNCSIVSLSDTFGTLLKNLTVIDLSNNKLNYLNPKSFDGMINTEYINMMSNKIQYISKLFIDAFPKMKTLLLDKNPLHCNCEMIWFSNWLRNLSTLNKTVTIGPCASPLLVSNKELLNLTIMELDQCSSPLAVFTIFEPPDVGYRFGVYCAAQGEPPPNITVYLPNNQSIEVTPRNKTLEQVTLQYNFPMFTCSYGGDYTCIARNARGEFTVKRSFTRLCQVNPNNPNEFYYELNGSINIKLALPTQPTIQTTLLPTGDNINGTFTDSDTNIMEDLLYIIIIAVLICILVLVIFIFLCYWCHARRHKKNKYPDETETDEFFIRREPRVFYMYMPENFGTSVM